MTRTRKTPKMIAVEEKYRQPLEKLLPEKINYMGQSATADELGVSKATLGYWNMKLGIVVHRVATAPGETIKIERISQN